MNAGNVWPLLWQQMPGGSLSSLGLEANLQPTTKLVLDTSNERPQIHFLWLLLFWHFLSGALGRVALCVWLTDYSVHAVLYVGGSLLFMAQ